MYVPEHFEESRVTVMHDLIRARPLATLVTLSSRGLNANHVPMTLSESPAPFGTLRAHVARANPLWRDLDNSGESLAIFHGPDAYISPSWYATKRETGKVVPTWNYAVVHACGRLRVVDDPIWLRHQLEDLVARNEAALPRPWAITDAPQDFVARQIESIVGLELIVARMSGKWKVSQNQPARNRSGVVEGLKASESCGAAQMKTLVEAWSESPDR